HQIQGLSAIPFAPALLLADQDTQLGGAPPVVDVAQVDATDEAHCRALIDGESVPGLVIVAQTLNSTARDLARLWMRYTAIQYGDGEVVVPPMPGSDHRLGEGTKCYSIASDIDDRRGGGFVGHMYVSLLCHIVVPRCLLSYDLIRQCEAAGTRV